MTTITAAMVKELREKTDAPMMECKKALVEADGDMVKAEELLRVKLGSKAGKAASRITAEGIIATYVDGNTAAMLELNSETDFVSKNDAFIQFGEALAKLVAEKNPADVAALSALPLTLGEFGPTVEDIRKGLIGKIGENMTIRRFVHYASAKKMAKYLHGTRIGVLVEYEGDEQAANDAAMQIAAMKPKALSADQVPAELVEQERKIAEQKALESGRPADIISKMIEGTVKKYLKEVSLLDQPFVKDDKMTVADMLKKANTTVSNYSLFIVGEGVEKAVGDFAAEVAAQMAAAKGA
ncbi:MAG: translation elongation factor Ts [Saezia sp.]